MNLDNLEKLRRRLLAMAEEQNVRQQMQYTVADIKDAVEREDVLRSAAAAIGNLADIRRLVES